MAQAAPYRWATKGDINAFFGLMLDNIANMVLLVSLLEAGWGLPAALVDRRLAQAAAFLAVAAAASLIGVIHSPHVGSPIGLPWRLPLPPVGSPSPYALALGYLLAAGLLWCWSWSGRGGPSPASQTSEK